MPLDRAHITVASQVMLPTYAVFFSVIGTNFLFGPESRTTGSPMLGYANSLMSIHVWGGLFLGCGILMTLALWLHNRDLYRFALIVCASSMGVWTAVAIAGIFSEPVSFSAWAWPGAMASACLASNRSLVRDRRHTTGG